MALTSPLRHRNQQASLSTRGLPGLSRKTSRLVKLWSEELHVRCSPRSVESYLSQVRAFLAWLLACGVDLPEARSTDLEAYHAAIFALRKDDGQPYASETQCSRLRAVKHLFRFLYRRSYLLADPAAALPMPRREGRLPRVVLSKEEVARILAAPQGRSPQELRDRALMETLYATGIRVTELINLTLEEVDIEQRLLRVVLGKGAKDRNLPLTSVACETIEAYLVKGRPYLLRHLALPTVMLGALAMPLLCAFWVEASLRRDRRQAPAGAPAVP